MILCIWSVYRFEFPVSQSELSKRDLELTVKNDTGMFSGNIKEIGMVTIDLKTMDVSKAVTEWWVPKYLLIVPHMEERHILEFRIQSNFINLNLTRSETQPLNLSANLVLNELNLCANLVLYELKFLSPRNSVGGDIVTRPFVGGWVSEWVGSWVRAWVRPTLPCGHDSDYSFWPITFKLHIHICHDERRNPIDHGSRGQRSRSTLALYK